MMFLCVQHSRCEPISVNTLTGISGIVLIRSGNEFDLKAAVATAGPVSVAVDNRPKSFRVQLYSSMAAWEIHFTFYNWEIYCMETIAIAIS